MQVLDGGGGNDCIVTFKDGPAYVTKGGAGNDTIIANLPSDTSDEQIDAICAGKASSSALSDRPWSTIRTKKPELSSETRVEPRAYAPAPSVAASTYIIIACLVAGMVVLLATLRFAAQRK